MANGKGGSAVELVGHLAPLEHDGTDPVCYRLRVGVEAIPLNSLLGKHLSFVFLREIACRHCGRKVTKTYNNGYCYPCFTRLAENDLCIVKPHLCHYEQGTCRDDGFARCHCFVPHYVYLAVSSGVKVGITRKDNARRRWVDQGAVRAIPVAEVPNRRLAGELEHHLSRYLPDKTNWRKMLKGEGEDADLLAVREEIRAHVPEPFRPYWLDDETVTEIAYPLVERVDKLTALSLDKRPAVTGRLIGVKGQYLLFAQGVFHVKKHTGYKVRVVWEA